LPEQHGAFWETDESIQVARQVTNDLPDKLLFEDLRFVLKPSLNICKVARHPNPIRGIEVEG
jgi:hypothetical protein